MTWEEAQDARKRRTEALNAGAVFVWGPRDRAPLSPLALEAAEAVGLTPDAYRAGCALLDRAPWHIRAAVEAEEVSTAHAYAALMEWEGGRA
ncbi:hypothetical protein [Deinococcus frigens]|uniref:hypothetical protein n=1 Tax=Deinococcus frigens TaxID=249403 RepID=UPI000495B790|nr:hypothetical protein [Deinococcus frigens]